ncbi:hypothetical protein ACFY1J_45630 [Streptomyces sp. NPDC001406]|uniref:hypothetical protein n=1 Tax=Streptomyces sp. NPDC001406 TaxID=3364572 RepID=UPI003675B22C
MKRGIRLARPAAFKGLLADQIRVLGPDHPDTLTTWDWLAEWRGRTEGAAVDPSTDS